MGELSGIFRNLVKKYHPDKVQDYPEWAHQRMTEINEAYELLARKITESVPQNHRQSQPKAESDDAIYDNGPLSRVTPFGSDVSGVFYPAFNTFLDGLGLYYQYGLENPAYRQEGVRRFRYREAMRLIISGRDTLIEYKSRFGHPVVDAASRYARLTVADIDLGTVPVSMDPRYYKYDKRMMKARKAFDESVKVIFFPEFIPNHLRSRYSSGLYSCYSEFIFYLTVFDKGERQKLGILQTARYDALITLIQLRNAELLVF
ncbi:MAG: hypothetical protein B0D92_04835 [Spirochaeta sp. LUC14_002_19_P3]|nr:MAG: hypothetical protein B0D92_04835 [Spirochaeta sp. LUC14_002_19_P3]